ncbi:hypothetical protein [Salinimicrobium sp. GXAS 041]|uniref:hypothetical protein n=1 Tax=Salinimicrobium sp. GXAS 041 TaxID=3400806 RepID=UPI003C78617D
MGIFTLLGIVIGVYLGSKSWEADNTDYIFGGFIGFLIGAFLGAMAALIIGTDTYTEKSVSYIEVLNDNQGISGSFFLGTGNINGEMKYVFYERNEDYFWLREIDYNRASIKYTDSIPVLETYKERCKPSLWGLNDSSNVYYVFRVPEGSIKTGYNLDAQ